MGKKRNILLISTILFASHYGGHCQTIVNWKPHPVSTRAFDETAPVLTREGLVYTTNQPSSTVYNEGDAYGYFLDLYISRVKDDGTWEKGKLFSESLKFPQHIGIASFNFNEDLIFFTRTKETPPPIGIIGLITGKRRVRNPELGMFYASRSDSVWENITEFPFNTGDNIHPCLSPMGDKIYFSSNRAGGFGGYDIYVSNYERGCWTTPQNLGPVINTAQNEIYPYLHSSGRLYFSSDGHDNRVGGFDIFYSDYYNNRWFKPIKMGNPYNSGRDDYTYYADQNFENGFFTSNRRGSIDIFTFRIDFPSFEVCKQQVKDNFCYIFFEESTVSLDTSLYLYEWDLGDGTKVRMIEAEHCFQGPGDYQVSLNVVDKLTGIVAFNQAEYLLEVRKVIQPVISCPDTLVLNQEYQLNAADSYIGGAIPSEYYWDFGDGLKDIGAMVKHTFTSPGTYTIKLGIIEESEEPETAQRFCSYKTIIVKE